MSNIFNFFGSALGYPLWFFYQLIHDYGVAIILFTVVLKLVLFPFSVRQQISMAANSRMALKQKELQKKYAGDKEKIQRETQKLYEQEGINPMGGCLTMALPLLVLMGLYYTVLYPLANTLHLSVDAINKASDMLHRIPGIGTSMSTQYAQIELVKNYTNLKPYLGMFSAQEISRIESFSHGFRFLGLNLLDTPCDPSNIFGTLFHSNLWVIPVFCLISSIVTQYFMNKIQPGMQQQRGCMKGMFYVFPLFTAWLACTMPAAVGFYWTISTLTGFAQTLILNIRYNPTDLNARAEARHVALREMEESARKPSPVPYEVPEEKQHPKSKKHR